ncbi:MAG: hypothetical protein Q4C37_00950, partial [Bacteroidales bacterium]|nr:hypothetical protein [Bacteroidales bacterium]
MHIIVKHPYFFTWEIFPFPRILFCLLLQDSLTVLLLVLLIVVGDKPGGAPFEMGGGLEVG